MNDDVKIKELYLMENGEEYWVISWTKGIIYICDRENPYENKNEYMYVKLIDPTDKDEYKTCIYKRVDNHKYKQDEILVKDDINFDFEEDEKVIGIWQSIDVVNNPEMFDPNKKFWKNKLFVNKIAFYPDGVVTFTINDDSTRTSRYSKNKIVAFISEDTYSKYTYKKIEDDEYLIVEWKSGDYAYGKMINCYYVFKKVSK